MGFIMTFSALYNYFDYFYASYSQWSTVLLLSYLFIYVCQYVWRELATSYAQSSPCLREIHVRGKLEVMGQGLPGLHALLFGHPSNRSQNKQVFQIATTSLLRCIVCKTAIVFCPWELHTWMQWNIIVSIPSSLLEHYHIPCSMSPPNLT